MRLVPCCVAVALTCSLAAPAFPAGKKAKEPKVDLNRIVNSSYSFLKNREPEMTGIEHALYERVVSMTGTRPEFALKMLETMLADEEEESPAFEFVLGNLYYTNKQYELSEQRYRSAVTKYPEYLRVWTNLGILYYATERFAEAIPCFSRAIELGDRDASTIGLLAYSLEKTGNTIAAEVCYMQAIAAEPSNPDWISGLMSIHLAQKQYGPAESLARRLVEAAPTEANHWLVYANIKIAQEKRLEAIAALETALQVGARDKDAILLLADLYAERSMFPEALERYTEGLALAGELGAERMLTFAQALIGEGRLDQAATVLEQMREVAPDLQSKVRTVRAELQVARKDWPAAQAELEEFLQSKPLDGDALMMLARVYRERGEEERAEFALQQAAQIEATSYRANVELANQAVRTRNYSTAVEHLQKALQQQRSTALEDYLTRIRALLPKDVEPPQA